VLFSSGLIAGGAIAGLLFAALAGLETSVVDASGVARPMPLLDAWGLALAPRLLGADAAKALADSAEWSIAALIALAIGLFLVARRTRS
jgi:hypothetical protein